MILSVTLLLLVMSLIILLYSDIENRFNYLYAGLIFAIALGALCEFIRVNIVPVVAHKEIFELIARFLSALSYRLSPFFGLLAGIGVYYQKINKAIFYKVFSIPLILGFIFDFIYPETSFITILADKSPSFWTIVIWAVPYGIIGNALVFLSYIKEKSWQFKRQKLLICFLMHPSLLLIINAYFMPLFFHIHPIQYTLVVDFILFILFIIFATKHGIMGVKIAIEKMAFDETMKVFSSGTMILLHALKNELITIAMNSECLDHSNSAANSIQKSAGRERRDCSFNTNSQIVFIFKGASRM